MLNSTETVLKIAEDDEQFQRFEIEQDDNHEKFHSCEIRNEDESDDGQIVNAPILSKLRDRKQLKKPDYLQSNLAELEDPCNFNKAVSSQDSMKWKKAIKEELNAHARNNTWTLT